MPGSKSIEFDTDDYLHSFFVLGSSRASYLIKYKGLTVINWGVSWVKGQHPGMCSLMPLKISQIDLI